ncbi:MAG TPA: hypothetical protein VEQ11_12195 [Chloroflexota bacterium]|nr:hypothetical protein [Chloroflexota bacterium]
MTRANLIFMVATPLVLIAGIALIVSGFGTLLLTLREIAFISDLARGLDEESAKESSKFIPVIVALAIASVFLIAGSVASMLSRPGPKQH